MRFLAGGYKEKKGAMYYHDGTNLVVLSPGVVGQSVVMGSDGEPTWEPAATIQYRWIGAKEFDIGFGTPAYATYGSAAGLVVPGWAFDAAGTEVANALVDVGIDPTLYASVSAQIFWMPSNTNTGQVDWVLGTSDITPGQQVDQADDEADDHFQSGDGTTDNLHVTPAVAVSRTTTFWKIRVIRNGADVADTYNADSIFLGVRIIFTP